MRCTCIRLLGTCVFLEDPRKTCACCTDRSCASKFLSWTTDCVGRGQISQELEGPSLSPSPNPVLAPLQVTVPPLLCRDTAKIAVPVLRRSGCLRGAQAAMKSDCYNVLSARGSALFPPLVMQHCVMQTDPASGRWVVPELSHHTRTEPRAAPGLRAGGGAEKIISF